MSETSTILPPTAAGTEASVLARQACRRRCWSLLAVGGGAGHEPLLTDRFTETTRNRAEVRLALYTGNLLSELQRTSVVPLLLARDPELIEALLKPAISPAPRQR